MAKVYDSLIIGTGPAGLSTALALGRVHRSCAIFSNSDFRNAGVHAAHAILGHDGKSPEQIRQAGRREIESYGNATFVETTIERVRKERSQEDSHDSFVVENSEGHIWRGRTLVLANGVKDIFPDLPGYAENWPSNIYQCMFCDGHERHKSPIGILAYPALSPIHFKFATMAHFLSLPPGAANDISIVRNPSRVTLFTNGPTNTNSDPGIAKGLETIAAHGIQIDERPVSQLVPDPTEGVHVHFDDSQSIYMGFLVHKPLTQLSRLSQSIVDQLGLSTSSSPAGTTVVTSPPFGQTSISGVYAAGDMAAPATHVTLAMSSGVGAAAGVAQHCNELDDSIALRRYQASHHSQPDKTSRLGGNVTVP